MAFVDGVKLNKEHIYCIVADTMNAFQTNIAKALTLTYEASYITCVRYVSLLVTIPLVEWESADEYSFQDLLLYIITAFIGTCGADLTIFSYESLGAGDSNAVIFGGSLILASIIGHLVLNELLSCQYSVLLLINCAGVVLVIKPQLIFSEGESDASAKEIGAVFALSGAFILSIWPVLIRQLARRGTLLCFVLIATHGLVGILCSGIWTTVNSAWRLPSTWTSLVLLISYGVICVTQFAIVTKALKAVEVKNVKVSLTISVVVSYILQITLFQEALDPVRMLGAIIVTICVILSSLWKYIGSLIRDSFSGGHNSPSSNVGEGYQLLQRDREVQQEP